jgi:hypothetical protein
MDGPVRGCGRIDEVDLLVRRPAAARADERARRAGAAVDVQVEVIGPVRERVERREPRVRGAGRHDHVERGRSRAAGREAVARIVSDGP